MLELWRLAHFLSGADYVHLENSATQIIRRVRYTDHGRPYVRYYGHNLVWLDRPTNWIVTLLTTRELSKPR